LVSEQEELLQSSVWAVPYWAPLQEASLTWHEEVSFTHVLDTAMHDFLGGN
jgi:hypothetical protein